MSWWVIEESELKAALERAHEGDDPGVVMVELLANSTVEDYREGGDNG